MAVPMQCHVSQKEIVQDEATPLYTQKWYFTRKEIEFHTPSRSDGIDYKNEQRLRKLYCAFLQELGIELKVPQVTIATAVMFCHRFYMRQSHAKNDWQTVATVCMFLAGKAEETPRWLGELVVVAYKLIHKGDPAAPRRIREIYDKQKELVVVGETLLLATLAFDLNIELPYKSLVGALKRLDITNNEILKVAWNFVNDWLRTSLCLQHKPHYIAAGSLFFAAKVMKVKLPTAKGKAWWMEFDVSPKQLEDVIQQMMSLWEQTQSQTQTVTPKDQNGSESLKKTIASCSKKTVDSKDQNVSESLKKTVASKDQNAGESLKKTIASCTTLSGSNIARDLKTVASKDACEPTKSMYSSVKQHTVKVDANSREPPNCPTIDTREPLICQTSNTREPPNCQTSDTGEPPNCQTSDTGEPPNCQTSDTGSGVSVVEDSENGEPATVKSDSISGCKIVSVRDIVGNSQLDIDRIREKLKKRSYNKAFKKTRVEEDMHGEIDGEAWIERELENGIVLESSQPEKKRKF